MVVDPVGIVVVDHLVERPELPPVGLEEPQGGLELLHRRLVVPQVGTALPGEEMHYRRQISALREEVLPLGPWRTKVETLRAMRPGVRVLKGGALPGLYP